MLLFNARGTCASAHNDVAYFEVCSAFYHYPIPPRFYTIMNSSIQPGSTYGNLHYTSFALIAIALFTMHCSGSEKALRTETPSSWPVHFHYFGSESVTVSLGAESATISPTESAMVYVPAQTALPLRVEVGGQEAVTYDLPRPVMVNREVHMDLLVHNERLFARNWFYYTDEDAQTQHKVYLNADRPPQPVQGTLNLPRGAVRVQTGGRGTPRNNPQTVRNTVRATVEFIVHEDGRISDLRLAESSKMKSFDRDMLKAVEQARFTPAMVQGEPVKALHRISRNRTVTAR